MRKVSLLVAVLLVALAGEANSETLAINFGSTKPVGTQNAYTFRALAGSKIQIRLEPSPEVLKWDAAWIRKMAELGYPPSSVPRQGSKPLYLALHAPDGSRICEPTRTGDVIEISTCTLPAFGTYTIIARCDGKSDLSLVCLAGDCLYTVEVDWSDRNRSRSERSKDGKAQETSLPTPGTMSRDTIEDRASSIDGVESQLKMTDPEVQAETDDCRAQCKVEFPDPLQEWHQKRCVKDCFRSNTSLAEKSMDGCLKRCNGSFSDDHELPERNDCYRKCFEMHKESPRIVARGAEPRSPADREADDRDRCIMSHCSGINVVNEVTRRMFDECCRSCQTQHRPYSAAQRRPSHDGAELESRSTVAPARTALPTWSLSPDVKVTKASISVEKEEGAYDALMHLVIKNVTDKDITAANIDGGCSSCPEQCNICKSGEKWEEQGSDGLPGLLKIPAQGVKEFKIRFARLKADLGASELPTPPKSKFTIGNVGATEGGGHLIIHIENGRQKLLQFTPTPRQIR